MKLSPGLRLGKSCLISGIALILIALSASSVRADANDGVYQGSVSSSDCGSGALLVSMTDGNLTGSVTISGTTYSLMGSVAYGSHLDFYTASNVYFFVGTIGSGTISGNYMTHNGAVCNGVSFSLSRLVSPNDSANIISQRSFDAVQELAARKEVTTRIVDEVFLAPEPKPSAGDLEVTPSATAAAGYQYFSIPASYAFSPRLKLGAALALAYADSSFFLGNLTGRATHYYGELDEQLVMTSVAIDLPTGDQKIGAGGFNVQASQTRVLDRDAIRFMFAYSYRYTSEVDRLNTGNTVNLAGGLDYPLGDLTFLDCDRAYGIVTGQHMSESTYDDAGLNDDKILLDLTAGLIWHQFNLRAGISVPILTLSDQIDNGDRLIAVDVGFRWGL